MENLAKKLEVGAESTIAANDNETDVERITPQRHIETRESGIVGANDNDDQTQAVTSLEKADLERINKIKYHLATIEKGVDPTESTNTLTDMAAGSEEVNRNDLTSASSGGGSGGGNGGDEIITQSSHTKSHDEKVSGPIAKILKFIGIPFKVFFYAAALGAWGIKPLVEKIFGFTGVTGGGTGVGKAKKKDDGHGGGHGGGHH